MHSISLSRLFVVLILAFSSCGQPEVSSLQMSLIADKQVMIYVEAIQVFAIKPQTADGKRISCDDFPKNYQLGDAQLLPCSNDTAEQLKCRTQIPWDRSQTSAELKITVPVGQELIFIVKGLANSTSGPLTVLRGCKDQVILSEGDSHKLVIDALATHGRSCTTQDECERYTGVTCHQDVNLPGGYCTKLSCVSTDDCPPASVCVNDPNYGGLCARPCLNINDCKGTSAFFACEGRRGPGGCEQICISHDWNPTTRCE